ncbi:NADPH-dependent FMN reductase [Actinokineospora sp. NBRC 105648]|uniref:NADPH-dependent FMN reductase n=1 Tax=Actinokineospora sp. NBRC 105648 TaxID=3032206 RepID=UPI0024A3B8C4|nr:NADPH-dependent FMN reductase [Actinokineospora sp. NBRC 105648]GLZ43695.1 FMN reductase (NADPH) [Actinokineospora sp. NBRC 105648]
MGSILIISGSPSPSARAGILVTHVANHLRERGETVTVLTVRDLPTVSLLAEDTGDPAIRAAIDLVSSADGLVVASPVYRAAYSGLVKSLLDLLPTGTLAGKAVLPLATGGTQGHLVAIDGVLRPLLFAMGATKVLQGHFLLDQMIADEHEGGVVRPLAAAALAEVLAGLTDAVARRRQTAPLASSATA